MADDTQSDNPKFRIKPTLFGWFWEAGEEAGWCFTRFAAIRMGAGSAMVQHTLIKYCANTEDTKCDK